ncbi:hypothetical protein GMMP15_1530021 [Candidatus Magnetomoraceae bacterium gMMP-15]
MKKYFVLKGNLADKELWCGECKNNEGNQNSQLKFYVWCVSEA